MTNIAHQFKIQNSKFRILRLLVTAVLALVLDQLTKAWIVANVAFQTPLYVIPGFARLRYTENTGAAFGFFQGWTGALSIVAVIIIVAIVLSASRVGTSAFGMIALGLVMGGALGNLMDRLRLGYVVDFVDLYGPRININNIPYSFPVFNVADSAITIGAMLLMATLLFGKSTPEPVATTTDATDGDESGARRPYVPMSRSTPRGTTPAGWAGLAVMLAGLFLIAFRQASKRL
jgi:signal peptidase II